VHDSAPPPRTRAALVWQVIAVLLLLTLLWKLRETLIVGFGAALIAAALVAGARPLSRITRLQRRWAVLLIALVTVLAFGLLFWAIGDPLAEQLRALRQELPKSWAALKAWLGRMPWGQQALDWLGEGTDSKLPLAGIATGVATGTLRAVSTTVLIVLMGVYLAIDLDLYRRGLLRLFPLPRREPVGVAVDAAGVALTRWMLGQVVLMVVVGLLTAIGLALLGMPMALVLGLVAGLLEFVPFFGPVVSGLLAVLVAFPVSPQMALYVALLVLAIQQLENHLLVPLVQRWAVELPPVLSLGAVLVFGTLFGISGVVFGTPLMVLAMVLVRTLYVEQTLEGSGRAEDTVVHRAGPLP
jgi:predicted PurR-regulated permease PerM